MYFDVDTDHEYTLPIKVERYCEKDPALFDFIRKRKPNADGHRDLRALVNNLRNRVFDRGKFRSDIVEITAVCYDNTILNQLNDTSDHPDADLFTLSVDYIDMTRPDYAFSEMTPMHEHSYVPHYDVIDKFKRARYVPAVVDRAPAAFSDGTNRDRWICFVCTDDLPIRHWTVNLLDVLSNSSGIAPARDFLLPVGKVPDELWEQRRVERRPGGEHHNGLPPDPRCTGKYLTRAVISGYVEGLRMKETKSFDIDKGTFPTLTSWGMSRICDNRKNSRAPPGVVDRFIDLAECSAATSFFPDQYNFLQRQPFDHAMKIISAAVPVGLLHSIYLTIVAHKRSADISRHLELNVIDVDEPPSPSSVSELGFDFENFTLPDECFTAYDVDSQHSQHLNDMQFDASDVRLDADATHAPVPEAAVDVKAEETPMNITLGKKLRVSRAKWPVLHPVDSSAYRAAVTRVTKLHNIYHINNELLEKVILCTRGHGCKPGDTRYLSPCDRCLESTDHTIRKHHHTDASRDRLLNIQPGQKWMIDGGDATVRSRWGSYRYFMVAVCCKTGYLVVYYMVDNTAKSFLQFIKYLTSITRLRCGISPTHIYGDYFSTHLSGLVAQMRINLGIELEVIPPYMHHLNPYAEGLMRILKTGCIRRLPALVGKEIFNEVVTAPREFWPWAMEHKVQSYNMQPSAMLERDTGRITTPIAEFDRKTNDDVLFNLKPFGSTVIVVTQPNQRISAMDAPTWRAVYLFSGLYNPFTHIYANAPRAHVAVKESGQLQITARVIFPDGDRAPFPAAYRPDTVPDASPAADLTPPVDSLPSSTTAQPTGTFFDSRPLVGAGSPAATAPTPPDTTNVSPFPTETTPPPTTAHSSDTAQPVNPYPNPYTTSPPATDLPDPTPTSTDDTPPVPATRRVHEPPEVPAATMPPIVQRFGVDASGNVQSRTPTPVTQETTDDGTRVVLEPMRIPPPDLIKTNSDIKITVTGSKRGKSGLRFDLYKSATTPAEYFRLHPGPNTPDMGKVTATAEWKFDVKHGHIRFEDNRYNDLAASYGMRGEELSVFFAEHPEDYEAAVRRSRRNILRCMTMNIANELDLTAEEVLHVQDQNSLNMPKRLRQYFHNTDVDEAVHDSVLYQMMISDVVETIHLQVEYDKNRHDSTRAARDDPAYKPKPEDLVVIEGLLQDLRGITDPIERQRMVKAIIKEIADLCAIGTFELVPLPPDRNAAKSRIVLKVKYFADGTYNKHKARLVAKGFMQRLGVDFFSVFSPMATLTTVRVLLALAVHEGSDIVHADIPQAFVQSLLDVDIWMEFPDGVRLKDQHGKQHKVARLIRSLYGLRNAPQLWNKALTNFFVNTIGYTQASSDGCLFYKTSPRGYVLVACEVDDLVITGTDTQGVKDLRQVVVFDLLARGQDNT